MQARLTIAPKLSTFGLDMGTNETKDALSAALFGQARRAVLGLLYSKVDQSYHLRDIVRRTNLGQGAVQREMERLSKAGILLREQRGRQVFYTANPACPIYNALREVVRKTMGMTEQLRQALLPLSKRISMAFIFGSLARGKENGKSDVDLMVIGDVTMREVVGAIEPVQSSASRAINPVVYPLDEYRKKLVDGHHFLTSLQDESKIFLIGNEDEFGRLA